MSPGDTLWRHFCVSVLKRPAAGVWGGRECEEDLGDGFSQLNL